MLDEASIAFTFSVSKDQYDKSSGILDAVWAEKTQKLRPIRYAIDIKKCIKCSKLLINDLINEFKIYSNTM